MDTVGELEREIERFAREEKNPEKLLEYFNKIPSPPSANKAAPIEIEILTIKRAPVMLALAEIRYEPAAKDIFDYIQKTTLTSEITAAAEALGKLGCKEAIPYMEKELKRAVMWHDKYEMNPKARAVCFVECEIRALRNALCKLLEQ